MQITRYVALALKARICLYEGTFRKYHANDPSTGKPWTTDEAETYLRAAVSACNELMTSKKYSLVSDPANVSTQYRKLFTSESVFTQEVIWARVYNAELNATHNLNSNFIVQQYGSYSLTNSSSIPISTSTVRGSPTNPAMKRPHSSTSSRIATTA